MTVTPPVVVPVPVPKPANSGGVHRAVVELGSLFGGLGMLATAAYNALEAHAGAATGTGVAGAILLIGHLLSRFGHDAAIAKATVEKYGPDAEKMITTVEQDVPGLSSRLGSLESDVKARLAALEKTQAGADLQSMYQHVDSYLQGKFAAQQQPAPVAEAPAAPAAPPAAG